MSLIKCPKCGEMFSDSYKTCPFCEEDEAYYGGRVKKARGRRTAENRKRRAPSILGPAVVIVLVLLVLLVVWLIFGDQIKQVFTGEKPPITDVQPDPDNSIDKPDEPVVTPTISLNRTVLALTVGDKETLQVNGTEDTVSWASSDPTLVSVTSSGEVTALAKGTAVITAQVGDEAVTCTVTVAEEADTPTPEPEPDDTTKPSSTKVDVSKLKLKLTMGEWVSTIESPNSDGNFEITSVQGEEWTLAVDGTTAAVTWSAESNNGVATVSGDTLKVTSSSSGRYTTLTGKVGDATIKLVVRIR